MSRLSEQLEVVTQQHYNNELIAELEKRHSWFLEWAQKHWSVTREFRYAHKSRPQGHEFSAADGKAVLRRLREGKPVSTGLVMKAVEAIRKDAYDEGHDDGAMENY